MPRTFIPMSLDDAANELQGFERNYASHLPEITEFHPLVGMNEGVMICAHDTANDDSFQTLLPREFLDAMKAEAADDQDFLDRTGAHLTRIARAVFN